MSNPRMGRTTPERAVPFEPRLARVKLIAARRAVAATFADVIAARAAKAGQDHGDAPEDPDQVIAQALELLEAAIVAHEAAVKADEESEAARNERALKEGAGTAEAFAFLGFFVAVALAAFSAYFGNFLGSWALSIVAGFVVGGFEMRSIKRKGRTGASSA